MTPISAAPAAEPSLLLPPPFTLVTVAEPTAVHAEACRRARAEDAAGTLVYAASEALIAVAVVLAPAEPLAQARRAFLIGMGALADALGSHAPPDKPLGLDWADTLRFDGARLGGGRLAPPEGCPEEAVPDWLVFSAMLIAAKRHAGDPGHTPGSTSLEEEAFPPGIGPALAESFAQYLMKGLSVLEEDGFQAAGTRYLAYLTPLPEARAALDETGDALVTSARGLSRLSLREALAAPAWLDPATGAPRL
ncbi:biotin/lipoate--protein ligase family protein [Methylobacterium oryzisoli]|uniref:biotin/lipoate--protein ligase family protein n=1 Tax=Methylobacterium oryzisoli TaxID=3385502 RepID=UPI0038921DDA